MNRLSVLTVLAAVLLALGAVQGIAQQAPVEIMVTGRQPGPPLWRVSKDDKVLWIFPYLSPVPRAMEWDSTKVAAVIAEADEVLGMPDVDVDLPLRLMLNPLNIVRGIRLGKRLTRNADGTTLQELLPPELDARYAALKERYFPRDKDLEKLRPLMAGARMSAIVEREVGLVSGSEVMDRIRQLIRKNRNIRRTPIEVKMEVEGSFSTLAQRAEAMMGSLSFEQELICFEARLRRLERELGDVQGRANAWARGYVDEFRGLPLPGSSDDSCAALVFTSSESVTVQDLLAQMDARWLEAAEQALARNQITFAVLDIGQLLQEDGLLAQLQARGYEIKAP